MLHIFIKYFFIIFCGFFLYKRLLNLQTNRQILIIQTISSIVLTILIYYIRLYFALDFIFILGLLFTSINFLLYKQSANVTLVTSLISLGCSYVLCILAIIIFMPISLFFISIFNNESALYEIAFLITGCIQLTLATIPFRFNRLKSGMPFLQKQGESDLGAFIAISLLIVIPLFNMIDGSPTYLLIPLLFIILCGILIFFWWKHKLTESYLTKVKEREIGELQKQITELKEYNAISSKIIHKDNKALPSMYYEVQHVLSELSEKVSEEDQKMLKDTLARLEELISERKGILTFSDNKAKSGYVTGSPAVDTLLKYEAAKAYSEQILFDVMISANVQLIIPEIISEADFRTIIADLVDNAFIAVRSEVKRNVLFHTRIENNRFYVDIYDSGTPFAKEVLQKLGKEAITTHKDTGGSGIGYMSTFEILKRCNGKHEIIEDLEMDTYTKKVSIYFPL